MMLAQQAPPPAPKKAKVTSSVMLWTLKGTFEERMEAAAKAGLQSVSSSANTTIGPMPISTV